MSGSLYPIVRRWLPCWRRCRSRWADEPANGEAMSGAESPGAFCPPTGTTGGVTSAGCANAVVKISSEWALTARADTGGGTGSNAAGRLTAVVSMGGTTAQLAANVIVTSGSLRSPQQTDVSGGQVGWSVMCHRHAGRPSRR